MKTMLRAVAIVMALGFVSSVFAASGQVSVASGEVLYVSHSGNRDGLLKLVDSSTNQTVVLLDYLTGVGVSLDYVAQGVSFSGDFSSSTISGLPAGNYELVFTEPDPQNWWDDLTDYFGDGAEVLSLPIGGGDPYLYWYVVIY